jgi:hypothetical protein
MVLPVLSILLFALIDLGIAAARYNALAESARRIAREAVLHGSLSPDEIEDWGPSEYVGTLADSSPIVAPAGVVAITMRRERVNVRVNWPDGDNSPRDRVQVHVSFRHEPIVPGLFPWGPMDLESTATMRIVN